MDKEREGGGGRKKERKGKLFLLRTLLSSIHSPSFLLLLLLLSVSKLPLKSKDSSSSLTKIHSPLSNIRASLERSSFPRAVCIVVQRTYAFDFTVNLAIFAIPIIVPRLSRKIVWRKKCSKLARKIRFH